MTKKSTMFMQEFRIPVSLRWADFDPNFHLRHSVYYDFGATARIAFFEALGIPMKMLAAQHLGPILFREEAIFRKEVRPGDELFINALVTKLRRDASRFSLRHELARTDGTVCAVMNVDGAWLDTQLRKLSVPPPFVADAMEGAARAEGFEWG